MKVYSANIATLKARLSEFLRLIARGHHIVVLDRKHPVAQLIPLESRHVNNSESRLKSVKPVEKSSFKSLPTLKPLEKAGKIDSLGLLLEDRNKR